MKVILSRKGFDSSNGGIVSPIMEDRTLLSFPIPSNDKDSYDQLIYCEDNYLKILKDLNYKGGLNCHVDPDLDCKRRINKINNWIPIFGQINSSSGYLLNTVKVEEGDLFLFFGNFHQVKKVNGKYQYVHKTNDFYQDKDLQVIWGYLQVGKIVTDPEIQKQYNWHPHSSEDRISNPSNVMFVASDKLSFNDKLPGAGLFKFDENKVLTLEGFNKATWIKRKVYDVDNVIGHRKNSSKTNDGIYYSGIWQELGLKESDETEEWAKSLF